MASVYRRGDKWYIRWHSAAGLWQSAPCAAQTKTEAKRLAVDKERQEDRARFGLEPMPSDCTLTLGEMCRWWIREYAQRDGSEEQRLDKHILRKQIAKVPVRLLTAALIDARLREMEREGAAAASLNKLRSMLYAIFSRAHKAGTYNGQNPVAGVERRRVVRDHQFETLRAEEIAPLLDSVPADWRALFACAIWTGMRKGELFGLRKSDVDLERGVIFVARSYSKATTKGGHADYIPIAEPLLPVLQAAIEIAPGDLVFPAPGHEGKMRSPQLDPQKVLRHALSRAGLVTAYEHICRTCKHAAREQHTWRHKDAAERCCMNEGCGRKLWLKAIPRNMRFHDLRHTAATLLFRAGVDPYRVQKILRHRDVKTTTAIYGHLDVEDLRPAINRMAPNMPPIALPTRAVANGNSEPLVTLVLQGASESRSDVNREGSAPTIPPAYLGAKCRIRTCGPCRVKAVLYR